jgi:hypothetical protein
MGRVRASDSAKKGAYGMLPGGNQYNLYFRRRLSAIIAINSLFVGFPLLFWIVYPK